ncbi:LPD7 domain-containing protein [Burkholderia gladioli]|uniref:LPD7 domain-containing protein n=1 Tax=Burkholderia gladioli TaxID=28095 RepID=UPI00264CCEF4|nr:LPD7 domain-containing protein [Burkholderia gladioli]MDN7465799.1 DUF5710 domain-containing protein [Burkholderia gladioli]
MSDNDVVRDGAGAQASRNADREYLNVPYEERLDAKALGAKFERKSKRWYVPEGIDAAPFARWRLAETISAERVPDERPAPVEWASNERLIEEEVRRLSLTTGMSLEDARDITLDLLRHRQEQGAQDAVAAFLQERAQLPRPANAQPVQQTTAGTEPADVAAPAAVNSEPRSLPSVDEVGLGRSFRSEILVLAASSVLRGEEVTRVVQLAERADALHHEVWKRTGQRDEGDRAIGQMLRRGEGFAAEPQPPQVMAIIARLRAQAGLDQLVPLAVDPSAADPAREAARERQEEQETEDLVATAKILNGAVQTRSTAAADNRPAVNEQLKASANDPDVDAPFVSAVVRNTDRRPVNEADARNPVNDAAGPKGELNANSAPSLPPGADAKRMEAARARDRKAAEEVIADAAKLASNQEKRVDGGASQPAPKAEGTRFSLGRKGKQTEEENSVELEHSLRKPILTKDGYGMPASIASRYLVTDGRFWKLEGQAAQAAAQTQAAHIEDIGVRLKSPHSDLATVVDMIAIAAAKNWDSITVKGDEEFRRNGWIAGSLAGMKVEGFKPTDADRALLASARQERDALAISAAKEAPAPAPAAPKAEAASKKNPTSSEKPVAAATEVKPTASQPAATATVAPGKQQLAESAPAKTTLEKIRPPKPDATDDRAIPLKGSVDARRKAWMEASLAGMKVEGFVPTAADRAALEDARRERDSLATAGVAPTLPPNVAGRDGIAGGDAQRAGGASLGSASMTVSAASATPSPGSAIPTAHAPTIATAREDIAKAIKHMAPSQRAEILNRFDARLAVAIKVDDQVRNGEIAPDQAASAIQAGYKELEASWRAPKAAPTVDRKPQHEHDLAPTHSPKLT